jgi:hypothetical protein
MLSSIAISAFVSGSVVLGTVSGNPDVGWVVAAVGATIWVDQRLARMSKKIDRLPCNRGKICGYQLQSDNEETTTV